jgi:hypothetical protein
VILDTNGNIFGGFTPVQWDSESKYKADPSLQSFLFTVKNPHNFPAWRFTLKGERKDYAICCYSTSGPKFDGLIVSDNCYAKSSSCAYDLNPIYAIDIGLDGYCFFASPGNFQVKDIEVFEISSSHRWKAWSLSVPSRKLESRAFWDFPAIFEEFQEQKFTLLWRGTRDGFGVSDFHNRCDGHANTLTVIMDTSGNIFGGFTPVEWESRSVWKADPSLKSFLFTLKNRHNVPAQRFALKAEKQNMAIPCDSNYGPFFGDDIYLYDKCNVNTDNCTSLGNSYTNDTVRNGKTFFTGSQCFQVREIEVFEITA